jgi:hypothetical protein
MQMWCALSEAGSSFTGKQQGQGQLWCVQLQKGFTRGPDQVVDV